MDTTAQIIKPKFNKNIVLDPKSTNYDQPHMDTTAQIIKPKFNKNIVLDPKSTNYDQSCGIDAAL